MIAERGCAWRHRTSPQARTLVLLGAIAAALTLIAYALAAPHRQSPGAALGVAAVHGYRQSVTAGLGEPDDTDLKADETDEGIMWAKANLPADDSACPRVSEAFRKGCANYLSGHLSKRP